ncbi:hypothetical protein EVG20_g10989, partial [Dentipellis fragilis]
MVTTAKKPSSKASVSAVANPAPAANKAHHAAHPSWTDMIKECIIAHPDEARSGVSRPAIKKFVESTYHIEPNASTNSHLARAITIGVEKGTFVLPKGPAGKVKLPSKGHKEPAKESAPGVLKKSTTVNKADVDTNKSAPAKAKVATKKSGAATPATKKGTATKATATKAAPAKKTTTTSRKTAAAKKGAAGSRAAAARKRGVMKRGVTGKTVGTKARKPRAK